MEENVFRWAVPGQFEICVLHGTLNMCQSQIHIDVVESDKSTKLEHAQKNKQHELLLHIPPCSSTEQQVKDDLKKQFCVCFEKLVTLTENTVGIRLDGVLTWPVDRFVMQFLTCLQSFKKGSLNYTRFTLCTQVRTIFDAALTVCEEYLTPLQENQPEGAMSESSGPLRVIVLEGLLNKVEVDTIACTVGADLKLNNGSSSRSLNQACGCRLQEQLDKKYTTLTDGEIAVLNIKSGSGLICQQVLFGVIFPFVKGKTELTEKSFYKSNVHNFMTRCFDKADFHKHTSIAFPAIGAGRLGYPIEIVAEQMFETARLYHIKGSLKTVMFVVYHEDPRHIQAFKQAEQKCHSQISTASNDVSLNAMAQSVRPKQKQTFTNQSKLSPEIAASVPEANYAVKTLVLKGTEDDLKNALYFYLDILPQDCEFVWSDGHIIVKCPEHQKAAKETWSMVLQKVDNLHKDFLLVNEDTFKLLQSDIKQRCAKDKINIIYKNCLVYTFGEQKPLLSKVKRDIEEMKNHVQRKLYENPSVANKDTVNSFGLSCNNPTLLGARPRYPISTKQPPWPKEAVKAGEFMTMEGIKVYVYKCNILKTPVHCIVNAANQKLDHSGGIAFTISFEAGHTLDDECKRILSKKPQGRLGVGDVCVTDPGRLPYACVIHAVGPIWDDYHPFTEKTVCECETKLYSAVFNSLTLAEELGMKSMAIPSISSGLFGVPKQMCAATYARAVADYSKMSRNRLQELHFVDIDDKMMELIYTAFHDVFKMGVSPKWYNVMNYVEKSNSMFKDSKVQRSKSINAVSKQTANYSGKEPNQPSNRNSLRLEMPSSRPASAETSLYFEGEIPGTKKTRGWTYYFFHSQIVHVYSTDLLGSSMPTIDMLACTDHPRGIEAGYLVKNLRKKAGTKYTKDKDKAFNKSGYVKEGDVVVCDGGTSGYKWIAVVAFFTFDPSEASEINRKKIRDMYFNIFKNAVQKNCRSIALPAFGTGLGSAKPEVSISHFTEGLVDFFTVHPNVKLSVHFVNHDKGINTIATKILANKFNMHRQQVDAGNKTSSSNAALSQSVNPSRSPGAWVNEGAGNKTSRSSAAFSKSVNPSRSPGAQVTGGQSVHAASYSEIQMSKSSTDSFANSMKASSTKKNLSQPNVDPHASWTPNVSDTRPSISAVLPHTPTGNIRMFDDSEDLSAASSKKSDERFLSPSKNEKSSLKGIPEEPIPGPDDNCVICMDKLKKPKMLKCGHTFCSDCIDQQFVYKEACPACGTVFGVIKGDQPDGTMEVWTNDREHCAGFDRCGRIEINYKFCDGTQTSSHPNPGKPYKGIRRTAYLPNNSRGRKIAEMLRVAFERKLVFTIGSSRTTGKEDVITWNDIHHKTDNKSNTQFGYPDDTYLDRVTDELKVKGITEDDIPQISSKRR